MGCLNIIAEDDLGMNDQVLEYEDSSSDSDEEVSENEGVTAKRGIKQKCPLNVLRSFHSVGGFPVDLLHDIFEGCCFTVLFFKARVYQEPLNKSLPCRNKVLTYFKTMFEHLTNLHLDKDFFHSGVVCQDLLGVIKTMVSRGEFSIEDYNKCLDSLRFPTYESSDKPMHIVGGSKSLKLKGKEGVFIVKSNQC